MLCFYAVVSDTMASIGIESRFEIAIDIRTHSCRHSGVLSSAHDIYGSGSPVKGTRHVNNKGCGLCGRSFHARVGLQMHFFDLVAPRAAVGSGFASLPRWASSTDDFCPFRWPTSGSNTQPSASDVGLNSLHL